MFGFKPIPYVTKEQLLKDNNLTSIRFLAFQPNLTVGIGCEGENPADRENILDKGIVFYPNAEDGQNNYAGIPAVRTDLTALLLIIFYYTKTFHSCILYNENLCCMLSLFQE